MAEALDSFVHIENNSFNEYTNYYMRLKFRQSRIRTTQLYRNIKFISLWILAAGSVNVEFGRSFRILGADAKYANR